MNPGIRRVIYDDVTNEYTDIEQFYMQLAPGDPTDKLKYESLYNYSTAYKEYNNLTPDRMDMVRQKLKTPLWWDRYYNYLFRNSNVQPRCNCLCKQNHHCAIHHVLHDAFQECYFGTLLYCSAAVNASISPLLLFISILAVRLVK